MDNVIGHLNGQRKQQEHPGNRRGGKGQCGNAHCNAVCKCSTLSYRGKITDIKIYQKMEVQMGAQASPLERELTCSLFLVIHMHKPLWYCMYFWSVQESDRTLGKIGMDNA